MMRRLVAASILLVCVTRARGQNVSEQYLLAAANQDRAGQGLLPLRVDAALVLAAREHAMAMVRNGTISHQFAGEPDLAARAVAAGARFSLVTENVAEAQSAPQIHDLWMHSPGHRANLLDGQVTAVGIAVIKDRGQLYAVEDFARLVVVLSLPEQEARVLASMRSAGVSQISVSDQARQSCGSAGATGPGPSFLMRYTSSDPGRLPEQLSARLATGKYQRAEVGACVADQRSSFASYRLAVLLYQ